MKGFGLKKAHKLVSQYKTVENVLKQLRVSEQLPLDPYQPDRNSLKSTVPNGLLDYEVKFHQVSNIQVVNHRCCSHLYCVIIKGNGYLSPSGRVRPSYSTGNSSLGI